MSFQIVRISFKDIQTFKELLKEIWKSLYYTLITENWERSLCQNWRVYPLINNFAKGTSHSAI